MNKLRGILYAVFSAVAFGTIPLFAVTAYSGGTNAITTAFLRFFIATLILYCILRFRKVPLSVDRKLLGRLSYISIAGYSATCITLFLSYEYISIGLATTMHFTYPAIVSVMSFFIFKEKLEPMKLFSLALSITGVYILAGSSEAAASIKGVIAALASGVFYSIYTIELARQEIKSMEGLLLTFYVCLFSSSAVFIFGAATGMLVFTIKLSGMLSILGLALICTVFAILLYYKAIQSIGPSDTAILSTFEPVTGVLLAILVFGEKLSPVTAIGSLFIIASVLFFSYNRNIQAREEGFSDVSEN